MTHVSAALKAEVEQRAGGRAGEEGGVIEVFNTLGDSIAVATVPLSDLEPLAEDEVH